MKTGMNYELDLQMIRPDGTTRWIAARGEAERDITGRITRLRGTGQDVTERKRAEHKIQEQANLLGLASDAILVRIIVATGRRLPPGGEQCPQIGRASVSRSRSIWLICWVLCNGCCTKRKYDENLPSDRRNPA